jgi:PKD repeat protein
MLLRPSIVVLVMLGAAGMVFTFINGEVPLPIDVLEPSNLRGLTAPATVTFGTESLRNILRKQSLYPRKYKWDFDGDGTPDAVRQDHEVTTVYRRKGVYNVTLSILLSDDSVRLATRRILIPAAVFSIHPQSPLLNEPVEFNAADLVGDPNDLDFLLWDFNGDGKGDLQTTEAKVTHAYSEVGTYQAQVTVQGKSGVQERYVRPITIVPEPPQPFEVRIETEGSLKGSAPLGVIFVAKVQEGVNIRETQWLFLPEGASEEEGERDRGERVAYTFTAIGKYEVILEVQDALGRVARKTQVVSVLEPLQLTDLIISGSPKPERGKIEGVAPLEVRLSASTKTPFVAFKWEQEHASRVFSVETEYRALYEEPGTYPVLLLARDAEDRLQKVPLEITVLPPKSRVVFTAIPPTGIAPLTVAFDASESTVPAGRITGFAWTFGDGGEREEPQLLGAKVTHRYEKEGTYTVIVKALTEEGQSFEARKTIVVRSATLSACAFPSRTVGTVPLEVRFDASCSTGTVTKYVWDFGDGTTSEETVPLKDHVFPTPGIYAVKLEIADDKGNLSSATVTITAR